MNINHHPCTPPGYEDGFRFSAKYFIEMLELPFTEHGRLLLRIAIASRGACREAK
jgi:hypothetical protein